MTAAFCSVFGPEGKDLSVIIPTYNCAQYLRDTLLSLKQTGHSLDKAQIRVVDDCSTKDDPKAVIDEVWPDRVQFYRHQRNVGPCTNFNACLDFARRPWIHLLHGDDYVLPGAYEEFAQCVKLCPGAIAVFARVVVVDANAKQLGNSAAIGSEKRGWLKYRPRQWVENVIRFPGVLLSRRAIEAVGKFDCRYCHVQDWDLWWRLARTGQVAYSNAIVAAYREFPSNHTASLRRHARNIEEALIQVRRVIDSLGPELSENCAEREAFYEPTFQWIFNQGRRFAGDDEAFRAHWNLLCSLPPQFQHRPKAFLLRMWHAAKSVTIRRAS